MNTQRITIQMPENLYERLQLLAEKRTSSLESELIEAVANALPAEEAQLSLELTQILNDLSMLDDKALWQAARSHLPRSASERLEILHHKRQREGLTASERDEDTTLLAQYERYLLVRVQAAVLLKQRGYDVSELIQRGGPMQSEISRITIDPTICHGKPVIRGLRYPVEMILELLSSGMT